MATSSCTCFMASPCAATPRPAPVQRMRPSSPCSNELVVAVVHQSACRSNNLPGRSSAGGPAPGSVRQAHACAVQRCAAQPEGAEREQNSLPAICRAASMLLAAGLSAALAGQPPALAAQSTRHAIRLRLNQTAPARRCLWLPANAEAAVTKVHAPNDRLGLCPMLTSHSNLCAASAAPEATSWQWIAPGWRGCWCRRCALGEARTLAARATRLPATVGFVTESQRIGWTALLP